MTDAPPELPSSPDPVNATGWPLIVLASVAVVAALYFGRDLFVPLFAAALISYSLDPLLRRLVAWRVPRPLAALLLMCGLVGAFVAGGFALRSQASAFVDKLPSITQRLRDVTRGGGGLFGKSVQPVQEAAAELKKAADEPAAPAPRGVTRVQVEETPPKLSDLLWRGTLSVFGILAQVTMVLFLVYYLLASGDQYKRKLLHVIGPSLFRKRMTLEILNEITEQVGRFLMARAIISVMVGVATGVALWWMGVSQPAVWGLAAGVLNNIPYLGPAAAVGAVSLAALVQFGSVPVATGVLGVTGLIAAIEGMVITPWIMGRAGRMNTGVVFVALMFWGWLWGVWGMLFAVPIMMAVKAVCDRVPEYEFASEFLRD